MKLLSALEIAFSISFSAQVEVVENHIWEETPPAIQPYALAQKVGLGSNS